MGSTDKEKIMEVLAERGVDSFFTLLRDALNDRGNDCQTAGYRFNFNSSWISRENQRAIKGAYFETARKYFAWASIIESVRVIK